MKVTNFATISFISQLPPRHMGLTFVESPQYLGSNGSKEWLPEKDHL